VTRLVQSDAATPQFFPAKLIPSGYNAMQRLDLHRWHQAAHRLLVGHPREPVEGVK
jgi:hypothetical protein